MGLETMTEKPGFGPAFITRGGSGVFAFGLVLGVALGLFGLILTA